jgi:tetratricopeptide (TPR) repeat protein
MDEHAASTESSSTPADTEPAVPEQPPVESVAAAPPAPPVPPAPPPPASVPEPPVAAPLPDPRSPDPPSPDPRSPDPPLPDPPLPDPPLPDPPLPDPPSPDPRVPDPPSPNPQLADPPLPDLRLPDPPSPNPPSPDPWSPDSPVSEFQPAGVDPPITGGAAELPPAGSAGGSLAYGVAEQTSAYDVAPVPPPTAEEVTGPILIERRVPPGPPRWPGGVALLNLTGLSLGYWYLGRRLRALLCLAVTIALVITAFATDAASRPWLWRAVAAVWVGWMAFDGWRLARRHPGSATAPRRRPALVATAVIFVIVAGYAMYNVGGNQAFAKGTAAQAAGDCEAAIARYDNVTGAYELTLNGNVSAAERNKAYCSAFVLAVAEHEGRRYGNAVDRYHEFLESTPPNSLDDHVHDRLQRTYLEWGHSARNAGDYPTAIEAFRDLLDEYGDGWSAEQASSELAQTYFDEAAAYRTKFDPTDSLALAHNVREAMRNYLTIQEDFPETVSAIEVPKAIVDTFNEAVRPFAGGSFCESLPVLDYLITLPPNQSAGVVGMAHEHRVKAVYECGVLRYGGGEFEEAIERFETVTVSYPQHALANAARSALIAATIAAEEPDTIPALPAPLGDNTPGTISVTFYNDTSVETEVLVSGATAHRFVVPGCPSCPVGYDDEADACKSGPAGKPSLELLLQPGEYHVLSRNTDEQAPAWAYLNTISVLSNYFHTICLYQSPR